jgi:general stress protein 26
MGAIKNFTGEAAIEKIRELAEGKMCLFCTVVNGAVASRPMSTAQVEEDGTLWFFSPKDSDKNQQIKAA